MRGKEEKSVRGEGSERREVRYGKREEGRRGKSKGKGEKKKRRCFFFNDTATTEIYTLSLHDALPILPILAAAAPPLFILPISRCGSAPDFYTANFLLRQRPAIYTEIGRAHV